MSPPSQRDAASCTRVQELEQTNDIITQQLDNAGTDQTKAVRDVERTLDKALFDMTRVQDNLRAEEAKSEAGVQRIIALENLGDLQSC